VFVDRSTGEVLLVDRFDQLSWATRAIDLLAPVHNARFMTLNTTSILLRLPWVVFGLAPGLLFFTGFLMWWNRVISKRWIAWALSAPRWLKGAGRTPQWARIGAIVAAMLLAARWIWAE
jgi:uncharacterized iron-regulated membrane protein